MDKVKIGLIGYGHWGQNIARCLNKSKYFNFTSCFDIDKDKALECKRLYSVDRYYTDGDKFIEEEHENRDLDAVAIFNPAEHHYETIKRFIENDIHVLSAKPISPYESEINELEELIEEHDVKFQVDHTYCYSEEILRVHDIVNSNEIGEVRSIECRRLNYGPFREIDPWWDLAPHDISIADFIFDFDELKLLDYEAKNVRGRTTGYDRCKMSIFGDGIGISIESSTSHYEKVREITITGEDGIIVWDDLADFPVTIYETDGDKIVNKESEAIEGDEPLQKMVDDFGHSIINGYEPVQTITTARKVTETLSQMDERVYYDRKKTP